MERKVILVDDEQWALKDMELSFPWKKYGFHIVGRYCSPTQAFTAIISLCPDVVVTDISMPEMSGIDILKETRAKNMNIAFVLVSGTKDFEAARQAIRYNAVEYVLKPLECDACDAVLQRIHLSLDPIHHTETKHDEVLEYIEANLHNKLTLHILSKELNISENTLMRFFKTELNTTFTSFVEERRMERACRLLRDRQLSIQEISELLGYSDQNYFSVCFKKCFHKSPYQFRAEKL